VAFRGALAHRIYVAFRDNARAKRPTFDTVNFGAVIALA